jgi:hypothetical protein
MSISTTPIEIIRGDDESITITVQDEDENSLLKSGAVLYLTIKEDFESDDDDAIFTKEYAISSDVASYTIDLSNTETILPVGNYYADIQWKSELGKIKTIYRGFINVAYDVTRRIA